LFPLVVIESLLVLLAAPVAGVLALARARARHAGRCIGPLPIESARAWRPVAELLAGTLFAAFASGVAWRAILPPAEASTAAIVRAHVAIAAVSWALASSGALAATRREPLSAIAFAGGGWLAASFGLIAFGPALIEVPTRALNVLLVASPFVVMTSSADVDLFRSPALYRASPIAHIGFDYPAWDVASMLYVFIALTCSLLAASRTNRYFRPHTTGWTSL
jgi:hypothetical protein